MPNKRGNPEQKQLAEEFILLRFVIGLMGMLLPVILVIGTILFSNTNPVQPSISHYYYTNMGNVFVAYIVTLAVFLFVYPGYDGDHWLGKIAFLFGCTFAFLPTEYKGGMASPECHVIFPYNPISIGRIHLVCASLFLVILAIYSFLFTKTNEVVSSEKDRAKKIKRNTVYIVCGVMMFISLAVTGILFLIEGEHIHETSHVFWGEVSALEFFGFSWFVKGGALWRDENTPGPTHRIKLFIKTGKVRKEELWALYNKEKNR